MELDKVNTMNAYHNLAGWLRDVRACLSDIKTNPMAGSYLAQLNDLMVDVEEMFDDGDMEDAEIGAELAEDEEGDDELIGDGDAPMAVQQPGVSRRARSLSRLVGAGQSPVVGGPAAVAGDVPPDMPATRGRRNRRTAAVAGAGKRSVKRGKK